ncbi:MAG: hypothetical protein ACJ8D0_12590, partial [Xanthobacteraceae bacterium]
NSVIRERHAQIHFELTPRLRARVAYCRSARVIARNSGHSSHFRSQCTAAARAAVVRSRHVEA